MNIHKLSYHSLPKQITYSICLLYFHQIFNRKPTTYHFKVNISLGNANEFVVSSFLLPRASKRRKFFKLSSTNNNKTHFDDSSRKLNSFGAFDMHRLFEYVEKMCLLNLRCLNRTEPMRRPLFIIPNDITYIHQRRDIWLQMLGNL